MHVLFLNSLYHPRILGGAERSVQFLAEALLRAGHRATVITTTPEKTGSSANVNGVEVHYVPVANIYWPFAPKGSSPLFHALDICNATMQARVAAILETARPDVMHTNTLVGFSVSAWRAAHARGIPVLHTLRDFYLLCPNAKMFRRGKNCGSVCAACRIYHGPKRGISRLVRGVVGNSRYMLDRHIAEGFFPAATLRTVIHNAYQFDGEPVANAAEPNAPLRLGYLGRLDEYKGVTHLLEAASRLPAGRIELLLAGKGEPEYETEVRARFAELPIQWLGFIPPEQLFSRIDALSVPSLWHEPLPRAVFEAYAHGVPVITSDRGGMPELVEHGVTGFMFDPAQPDALFTILQRVTAQKSILTEMRAACLCRAADFSPARIAESYQAAYRAIANS